MRTFGLILAGLVLGLVLAPWLSPGVRAVPGAEPRMLGSWTPDGYHAAARTGATRGAVGGAMRLGDALPGIGGSVEPAYLTTEPAQSAWALAFTAQKGGAFTGTATSPEGESTPVVGAFRSDGRRFVYSTPFGSGSGEVDSGTMEWCATDTVQSLAGAACTVYRKAR